jgi:hypothetical protein
MNTAIYLKKQGAGNPTYSHAVSNLKPYAKLNIFQLNPFTATFAKHQLAHPSTFQIKHKHCIFDRRKILYHFKSHMLKLSLPVPVSVFRQWYEE